MQLDKADSKRRENSLTVVHHRASEHRDLNNPKSHKPPMEEEGFAGPLSQSGRQGLRLSVSADNSPPSSGHLDLAAQFGKCSRNAHLLWSNSYFK